MTVVLSIQADLSGDGQLETVESTDDNQTIVIKNGTVIWDNSGWIGGWNRRRWDGLLAADVDHDGRQEVVIWNNQNGWTGVLKWQANALSLLWGAPSPLTGPAGQWNRRASDQFSQTSYNAEVAIAVAHPEDGWHGILVWQGGALQPVHITKDKDNKEPGDKEPGEKEPGEKEPGEKEPGEKDPGEKEPGEKEPGEKEPGETDGALLAEEGPYPPVEGEAPRHSPLVEGPESLVHMARPIV